MIAINATIYRVTFRVGLDDVSLLGQNWTKTPLQWAGLKKDPKRTKNNH